MSQAADRRLPARFRLPLTGLLVTGIMTFIISGISTAMALGVSMMALGAWPIAWISSWMVAFPVILLVLPFVQSLVSRLVAPP